MPLELHIPPCIDSPPSPVHLPPADKPLRIQIQGPVITIKKLFPADVNALQREASPLPEAASQGETASQHAAAPYHKNVWKRVEEVNSYNRDGTGIWHVNVWNPGFPQPGAQPLAEIAFRAVYGREARPAEIPGDLVVRDEYLGWIPDLVFKAIDYYGVTFDHLVPPDDDDPEVLHLGILELDEDDGRFARQHLRFAPDAREYTGKKVLAVPRCCHKTKGRTDRCRINRLVADRDAALALKS